MWEWGSSGFTLCSWGRLCGEPTAACSCPCCIIQQQVSKGNISWGSPCCTLLEEPTGARGAGHTCGQKFSCNPDPQLQGKAAGSAAVAPQSLYPLLTPSCHLAALHPCCSTALQPCCSPAAPPLHQAWAEPCSHVLPAVCKHRHHLFFMAWKQVGVRKTKMWRALCIALGMGSSALPDAFLVLTLARGVLAPNSSILVFFMWLLLLVSHWHPEQVTEISIWLRTRENLLPT